MSGAANHDDDAAQRENEADRERFAENEAFDEISMQALSDLQLDHEPHAEFVRKAIHDMIFLKGADAITVLPKIDGCSPATGEAVDAALARAWVLAREFWCVRVFVGLGCDDAVAEDLIDCLNRVKRGIVSVQEAATGVDELGRVPKTATRYWRGLLRKAGAYAQKHPRQEPAVEVTIATLVNDVVDEEDVETASVMATTREFAPVNKPKTFAEAVSQDPALDKLDAIDLPAYARKAWGDAEFAPTKFFAASALYSDASTQPHAVAWKVRVAAPFWTYEGLQNASSGWRGNALKVAPRVVAVTRGAVTYVMCAPRGILKKIDPATRVTILRDDAVAPAPVAPKYAKWARPACLPTFIVADTNGDDIADRWIKDRVTFGVSTKRKALSVDSDTFAGKRALWELTFPPSVTIHSVFKFAVELKQPDTTIIDQYGHVFGWTPLTDAQVADAKTKARYFAHGARGVAAGTQHSGANATAAAEKLVEVVMVRSDGGPMEHDEVKEVMETEKFEYVRLKVAIRLVTILCRKEQAAAYPEAVEHYWFIQGSGGPHVRAQAPAAAGPPDDPGDDAAPPSAAADGRGV